MAFRMTEDDNVWPGGPMPTILNDDAPSFSKPRSRDQRRRGPVFGEAERDAGRPDVDEPISAYARQVGRTLNAGVQYLRDDVARGGAGPVLRTRCHC
jgi:hypothetical protein